MEIAPKSKYWLDVVTEQIEVAHPTGDLVIESGHSPSGNYHVGFLREFVIASAIAAKLRTNGRQASHIDFVDDFDVFRKVPANVSAEWEQHLGTPLYLVPDPFGDCHESYADHFLSGLYDALKELGAEFESIRSHQRYGAGAFAPYIEKSLDGLDRIKDIIAEVSHRQLDNDWSPVQILSDDHSLRDWHYTGWDKNRGVVTYRSNDGGRGEVSYKDGRVKLDWRIDWPARWAMLGISAEPFGRDHASKGGSYDTGAAIVRQIFDAEPPLAIPYEFVNLVGQTKKMSKSAGNVVTPADVLEIMPPEVLRYFLGKSRPAKTLFFDPGVGLSNLIDEFAKVEAAVRAGEPTDFTEAYELASASGRTQATVSTVPFSHLATVYQAAQGDTGRVLELLERTGHGEAVKQQSEVIKSELEYVRTWLDRYAPAEVKFSLQEKLPTVELSDVGARFLDLLADRVETMGDLEAQAVHDAIYAAKDEVGLEPGPAFAVIYQVLIGRDQGPRAGLFVATVAAVKGREWLAQRFRLQA